MEKTATVTRAHKQMKTTQGLRAQRRGHLILVSALLSLLCCTTRENVPVSEDLIESPYQEFGTATLFFFEGSVQRWRLESDYINKPLSDTAIVTVIPVNIMIYDENENPATLILADTGYSSGDMELFNLRGGVYIRTEDSLVVRTDRLKWIKEKRKVESDDYVQIETPRGDVLRGKGLDAVDDFSTFSFRSNITGRFPDFQRRLEQDEAIFR